MKTIMSLILMAMGVLTTSVAISFSNENIKAEPIHVIETDEAKPVKIPYLDMDIKHLSCIRKENEDDTALRLREENCGGITETEQTIEEPERDFDGVDIVDTETSGEDGGSEGEEEPEPEPECVIEYLGQWTITAYCPCEICCGEYSSGYTASGTLATANHTIACNDLPFGTRVIIDDIVYTVEDTGWTPYGSAWIDIFFDSHEEALAYGCQVKDIYLVTS